MANKKRARALHVKTPEAAAKELGLMSPDSARAALAEAFDLIAPSNGTPGHYPKTLASSMAALAFSWGMGHPQEARLFAERARERGNFFQLELPAFACVGAHWGAHGEPGFDFDIATNMLIDMFGGHEMERNFIAVDSEKPLLPDDRKLANALKACLQTAAEACWPLDGEFDGEPFANGKEAILEALASRSISQENVAPRSDPGLFRSCFIQACEPAEIEKACPGAAKAARRRSL